MNVFERRQHLYPTPSQRTRFNGAVFSMLRTPRVNIVPLQKAPLHLETHNISYKAGTFILRIPVPRNLDGVLLTQHRIKDRLLRKPRRKFPKSRLANQIKFRLSHRAGTVRSPLPSVTSKITCRPARPSSLVLSSSPDWVRTIFAGEGARATQVLPASERTVSAGCQRPATRDDVHQSPTW